LCILGKKGEVSEPNGSKRGAKGVFE